MMIKSAEVKTWFASMVSVVKVGCDMGSGFLAKKQSKLAFFWLQTTVCNNFSNMNDLYHMIWYSLLFFYKAMWQLYWFEKCGKFKIQNCVTETK